MSTALTITKSKLILSPIQSTKSRDQLSMRSRKNLIRNKEYNGYISRPTKKRIERMVENLIFAIQAFQKKNKGKKGASSIQPTFITLTLSYEQIQSDNFIKRNLLMRFIEKIKKNCGVENYIWRAEPQRNGNIHFHIIADRFIKWQTIRAYWNEIQSKYDYIDAFEQRNGHRNPNSTDIHALNKINNIAAYICKYMTKDKPSRKIEGRIWGCSSNFHKMKNPRIEITGEMIEEVEDLVKESKGFKKVYDYCTLIRFKKSCITSIIKSNLYRLYEKFVNSFININIINHESQLQL